VTAVGTLGFVALAGLRTHFKVFPLLTHVYVTPLVFCEIPAFVHLPPFDAAEVDTAEISVRETKHMHNAPTNFLVWITLKTYSEVNLSGCAISDSNQVTPHGVSLKYDTQKDSPICNIFHLHYLAYKLQVVR
jgi:hypothetical protein